MNINKLLQLKISQFVGQKQENTVPVNWHEDFIVHLAQILRPKVYVELGLYQSTLFNRIIPYADQLVGVDMESKLEEFMQKNPKTTFKAMTTDDYAEELKSNPIEINLLFIDANHSAKSVKKDFENFFPFIAQNGLILLHDSYPESKFYTSSGYCGDGYRTIEKLSQSAQKYEMMTIPVHPGLTMCRKREKQLFW